VYKRIYTLHKDITGNTFLTPDENGMQITYNPVLSNFIAYHYSGLRGGYTSRQCEEEDWPEVERAL